MTCLPRCYLNRRELSVAPMGSSFGHLFRITTWGESNGGAVGVVTDGCPPQIELSEADIQRELDRRRPGQSAIVTPRDEADRCQILSGVFEGRTLGTPISILVMNKDARPEAYAEMKSTYRPSHADFTYEAKYGIRNWQGGGRASARETVGRVAAGAVARKVLSTLFPGFELIAYVNHVYDVTSTVDPAAVTTGQGETARESPREWRLVRRSHRLRRPRRSRRAGRTGFRQIGGRSGESDAEP